MIKNITPFGKFKDIKNKPEEKINELVEPRDNEYDVTLTFTVPKTLINGYIKKVKDETNKDLRQTKSEAGLAEQMVSYLVQNYLVIENLPVDMAVSTDQKAVQAQAQTQVQPDIQLQDEPEAQDEPIQTDGAQVQVSQPGAQAQVGQGQAQIAAQKIPQTEI